MRLEVEIIDYSDGENYIKVLPLQEAIALKEEIDRQENKAAYLSLPKDDVSGYIFSLGEDINVLVDTNCVGDKVSHRPVLRVAASELTPAIVHTVSGRFEPSDEEKWKIEKNSYLSVKPPQEDKPSAGRYRGFFRLESRSPIPESEIKAAKAEVERLWSFAAKKTQACREIFQKLSPDEQEFLRKNLRSGIAPED